MAIVSPARLPNSDGKQVTFKTDYAGEIKVQWSAQSRNSLHEKPLYVVTPDKKTVNGNVTVEGSDLIVHTANAGDVRVPMTQNTMIRSADAEQAYEKSLHPRLLDNWQGGINVGFALARGNSDTHQPRTRDLPRDRKTLSDEVKLYASSIYSTNGPNTTGAAGGVTAE